MPETPAPIESESPEQPKFGGDAPALQTFITAKDVTETGKAPPKKVAAPETSPIQSEIPNVPNLGAMQQGH